ncbi:MAG: lipocalin family protein [Bacteroidales bacterium]|nr:lipocalin family protein [Bacteroidales bacterium]
MKLKHLLIFTVVFALVALGTSCSKASEKKITGKWQLVSEQYRDNEDPEWDFDYPDADEVYIYEFVKDGNCYMYYNGRQVDSGTWIYDKSTEKIIVDGESADVIKCTSTEMVWGFKETWGDEWYEEQINFKRVK